MSVPHPSHRIIPPSRQELLAEAGRAFKAIGELLDALAHEPAPTADISQLLDAKQIAERIGCSVSEARRLISTGELPAVRIGRLVRIRAATLERWIIEHERGLDRPDSEIPWGLRS